MHLHPDASGLISHQTWVLNAAGVGAVLECSVALLKRSCSFYTCKIFMLLRSKNDTSFFTG